MKADQEMVKFNKIQKFCVLGYGSAQRDLSRWLEQNEVACHYIAPDWIPAKGERGLVENLRSHQKIRDYVRSEQCDYVYSVGSDIGLYTSAYVAEQCGLPHFVSAKVAALCLHKGKVRRRLGDHWMNTPFRILRSEVDLDGWETYPAMLKPVDSQGQRGVVQVKKAEEVERYLPSVLAWSACGQAILEPYQEGPELSVHLFLIAAKTTFFHVADRETLGPEQGLVSGHVAPSAVVRQGDSRQLQRACEEVARRLGIEDGPVYAQVKWTPSGPRLIEITPRLDGCHLWLAIASSSGINLLEMTVDKLMGRLPSGRVERKRAPKNVRLSFFLGKPGEKFCRQNYRAPAGAEVKWYYQEGDLIRSTNGVSEKLGHYLI